MLSRLIWNIFNAEPLTNELRTIDGGAYKQSGTWRDVPEHKQPKEWPLGDPSIQPCPFCLEPNAQNAERLKALENAEEKK